MSHWDDDEEVGADQVEVDRAPICPFCGVTALPAEEAGGLDTEFVCDNPDCEAYGDVV